VTRSESGGFTNPSGIKNGVERDMFAIAIPPSCFAAAAAVQRERALVDVHVDRHKLRNVTNGANHVRCPCVSTPDPPR
jgi:hypothetical protein